MPRMVRRGGTPTDREASPASSPLPKSTSMQTERSTRNCSDGDYWSEPDEPSPSSRGAPVSAYPFFEGRCPSRAICLAGGLAPRSVVWRVADLDARVDHRAAGSTRKRALRNPAFVWSPDVRRRQIGGFCRLQGRKGTRINIVDMPPYVESQSLAQKTAIAALRSGGSNTGARCRCTCRYASSRYLSTHPRTVFAQTPHGVRQTRTIPRPCRARHCTTGNTSLYRHTGDPGDPTSCKPTTPPTARMRPGRL